MEPPACECWIPVFTPDMESESQYCIVINLSDVFSFLKKRVMQRNLVYL